MNKKERHYIENHVTSLEDSKRMKELGFPQQLNYGNFVWMRGLVGRASWLKIEDKPVLRVVWQDNERKRFEKAGYYKAYLLTELIDIFMQFGDSSVALYRNIRITDDNIIRKIAALAIKLAEEGILQFKK